MHLNRDSSTIVCAAFLLTACAAAYGGECCLVNEHQAFTPDTADAGDNFGFSLGMSGLRLVAGAPGTDHEDVPPITDAGMVYIYDLDDELWVQDESIISSDPDIGDRFGYSVGISGDRVIAGAPFDDPSAVSNAGSAYVYIADSGGWDQEQKLNASDATAGDRFGYSVAISGNVAVIGAPEDDHSSVTNAGAVYIFRNNGSGVWSQEQKLVSPNPATNLWFGASVAIDGTSIIVGEPNSTGGPSSGKAHVFTYGGSSWSHQDILQPTFGTTSDLDFGTSVAISGDFAVVGGPNSGGGSTVVFKRTGSSWSEDTVLAPCDHATGDRYGTAVTIDGDTLISGSPRHDNGDSNIGAAYVWRKLGEGWSEIAKLIACDSTTGDEFGSAVTFAGGLTAIGAPMKQISTDTDQGQSYNFAGFSPCECVGDVNESGTVNGTDLALLLGEWTGSSAYAPCPPLNDADLNGDCHVDGVDLALLLGSWGRCPGDEDCVESFGGAPESSGGEGELTEDQVAALLGFSDAASFYDWVQTADADDVQAAGLTLLALLGE